MKYVLRPKRRHYSNISNNGTTIGARRSTGIGWDVTYSVPPPGSPYLGVTVVGPTRASPNLKTKRFM
jgi:hypothetical protein